MSATLHATCVAIGGRGVLLTGASGSGKSDLALRLIDRGAELVSDDGTVVGVRDGRLIACAGPNIAGRIEARGIGILDCPYRKESPLALVVGLDGESPRMAEEPLPTRIIEGIALPQIALAAFEASAPLKVEQALLRHGLPSPAFAGEGGDPSRSDGEDEGLPSTQKEEDPHPTLSRESGRGLRTT